MTQGIQERVSVVVGITKQDLDRVLDKVLNPPGRPRPRGRLEPEQIRVSSSMLVRLTGDPSLSIQELSTPEQEIRTGEPTSWHWDVIPTSAGKAQLNLIVSCRVRSLDGFVSARALGPRVIHIEVRWKMSYWIKKFFNDNLAAVVGICTVLSALFGMPWRSARRRTRAFWSRLKRGVMRLTHLVKRRRQ
jgi:hypothetical protein